MKRAVLIITLLITAQSIAQKVQHGETNKWFTMINQARLSEHWQISLETHNRYGDFFKTQGQFLIRPSLDYVVNSELSFSFGYTFIRSEPYEPYTMPIGRNENNIWEQALLKYDVGEFKFQNRLRQENRWIQRIETSDSNHVINGIDYANRLRFRWTVTRNLYTFKNKHELFFSAFDEIWITQNDRLKPVDFARNWFYAGLGYAFSSDLNVQLGYMHQWDKVGDAHFIATPILQTTFIWNFDFRKAK